MKSLQEFAFEFCSTKELSTIENDYLRDRFFGKRFRSISREAARIGRVKNISISIRVHNKSEFGDVIVIHNKNGQLECYLPIIY